MRVPHLNRQLILEEAMQTADGAGGFVTVWTALAPLWAEVKPGAGRDPLGEEVVLSAVSSKVTLRAAPMGDVRRPRPDQRFREGARVFQILAVTERDPGGRYLTCFCREEAPR